VTPSTPFRRHRSSKNSESATSPFALQELLGKANDALCGLSVDIDVGHERTVQADFIGRGSDRAFIYRKLNARMLEPAATAMY